MLNMVPLKDAKRAESYFGKSDGGYYITDDELRREWGGKAAAKLRTGRHADARRIPEAVAGLRPRHRQAAHRHADRGADAGLGFHRQPAQGRQHGAGGRRQPHQALFWQAANEAMEDVEKQATTRVRKGGMDADRVTGNMAWLAVEHPDTRPAKEDGKPDWDRHIHFVVANATFDEVEGQWKALKVRAMFDLRKYFSHAFDQRMAKKLAELGYEIETKLQPDKHGGMKYHTWDIKAAPGHEAGWHPSTTRTAAAPMKSRTRKRKSSRQMKAARSRTHPISLSPVASAKLAPDDAAGKARGHDARRSAGLLAITHHAGGTAAIDETIRRAKKGLKP